MSEQDSPIKRKRGNYGDLDAYLMGTENFDWFKKYLKLIEGLLATEEHEIRKGWDKYHNESEQKDEDATEALFRRSYQFEEHKRILLGSFTSGVWSSIEQLFIAFCFGARFEKESVFKYSDLKGGRGMGQAQNYIKALLNVDLPINVRTRDDFNVARIVRNALVHAEGLISNDQELRMIQRYSKEHPNEMTIDEHTRMVRLDISYAGALLELHKAMRGEFQAYLDEIEKLS